MEFERYTVRSTWIVSQLISKMPSRREHEVDISDSLVVAFILGVRETHASHSHTRITPSKKKLGAHTQRCGVLISVERVSAERWTYGTKLILRKPPYTVLLSTFPSPPPPHTQLSKPISSQHLLGSGLPDVELLSRLCYGSSHQLPSL